MLSWNLLRYFFRKMTKQMVLVEHTRTESKSKKWSRLFFPLDFWSGEVFANKQDLMGSCPAPDIAEALNLETWIVSAPERSAQRYYGPRRACLTFVGNWIIIPKPCQISMRYLDGWACLKKYNNNLKRLSCRHTHIKLRVNWNCVACVWWSSLKGGYKAWVEPP